MIIDRLSTTFDVAVADPSEIIIGFTVSVLPMTIPNSGILKLFYKVGNISVEVPSSSWSLVSNEYGYDIVVTDYGFPDSGQLVLQVTSETPIDWFYGQSKYATIPYQVSLGNFIYIGDTPVEYISRNFSYKPMSEDIAYTPIDSSSLSLSFSNWNPDTGSYDLNMLTINPGVVPDPGSFYTIKEVAVWRYPINITLLKNTTVSVSQTLSNYLRTYSSDSEIQIGDTFQITVPPGYTFSDTGTKSSYTLSLYDFETQQFIPLSVDDYAHVEGNTITITSPVHYPQYQNIPLKISANRTSQGTSVSQSNYPLFTLNSDYLWEGYGYGYS